VGFVLHLSDLHLGEPEPWQILGDHKQELVAPHSRTSTQTVLKRTLEALHREDKFKELEAILISGDITNRTGPEGFRDLYGVLAIFGDELPKEKILVVPGNHDVRWGTPPGTAERYEAFLEVTRERGFATPLIDGVDFGSGVGDEETQANAHPHLVETEGLVAVAINSSNLCGVLDSFADDFSAEAWAEALKPEFRDEALRQLNHLRMYDVPYVSDAQIEALRRFLERKGLSRADGRLRIAVMHHHLLPVSTAEEIKAYESVVDLGRVRQFLTDLDFHVVLHGHKHRSAMYWDRGTLPAADPQGLPCEVFVLSGPGKFEPGQPICRVLEIGGNRSAHYIRLHTVLGTEAGQLRPEVSVNHVPVWEAESRWRSDQRRVHGRNTSEVYAQILAMFDSGATRGPIQNFYCEVEGPDGADQLPDAYPKTGHTDDQEWFRGLVDWWQRPKSRLLEFLPFNHGERLHGWYGLQLKRAARVLDREDDTSRAIAILVDPKEEAGNGEKEYPAFVLAQFKLVREGLGPWRLDVIAYFRKQEMRYWWPINTAELALMQRSVIDELAVLGRQVQPGRLATFSAIALVGNEVPGVAVAEIDRAMDEPDRLWKMAAEVAHNFGDQGALSDWGRIVSDLLPLEGQRLVLPRAGLDELVGQLKLFERLAADRVRPVRERVEQLAREVAVARDSRSPEQLKQEVLRTHVDSLKEALEGVLEGIPRNKD
jgi:3',5'-cyclic AMP phosphodiesterase CpdA